MRVSNGGAVHNSIKVLTAEQMRALDLRASQQYSIPSILLMENAGHAVYNAAVAMLGQVCGGKVLVVAGQGNNGGDGFVVARHLANAGVNVTVAYYGDRKKAKGDALTNIDIAERMHLNIVTNCFDDEFWTCCKDGCDLIIDALLGTGIQGTVREPHANVIGLMNECRGKKLAVDIPSGVDADTGAILGTAFRADVTVTFALPKIGLVTYPGAGMVGHLYVADISIPSETLQNNEASVFLLNRPLDIGENARRPDANKSSFGHLAIIAGSVGMTGAASLAAQGALRIGTGLVTVAVPESLNDIMEVKLTEAMTIPVREGETRAFGLASLSPVTDIIDKRDAVVVGPGFGRNQDTIAFVLDLIPRLNKPAVIDADALFALSIHPEVMEDCQVPVVITPHPGEMARLVGTTVADVQSNRLEVARNIASKYGVTVVLKGAGTVITEPDGRAYINTSGTPGMATGGTGDVLAGMIGGLLAGGYRPADAACSAVYLHGKAGEMAAEEHGEAAMLASDVVNYIGMAINCALRVPVTANFPERFNNQNA